MNSTRVLGALLIASLVDLAAIVVTGDVSFLGSVGSTGFVLRIAFALVLLGVSYVRRKEPRRAALYGYAVVLLVLVSLLHVRGYRLRGDGLWYYSYAHSVAIDGDVDLGNQYRRLGIDTARGSQTVRETGRARYTFPVGAPLAWVPFVWLGHVGAAFRNAYGLETAYDGYADPYFHAVALGNLLIGWLGLLVLDRFLRRWFPPWVAFWATAGVGLGSFFSWYLAYHSIYTHALTFLLIVLFLELWVRGPSSVREYALLGLVLGAAACVRWQNAVFCLLPAYTLAGKLCQKDWRFVAGAGGAFGLAVLLGLVPQFWSWNQIFGSYYVGVPQGVGYVRWLEPFVTETLFASRHGLFSWSPLLLFAALGLPGFVRRQPRTGLPLLGMLVLLTYINSSVTDWWAGGSFGARRFDSVLPILALGLATTIAYADALVRRQPRAVTAALVVMFVIGNGLLMEQYRKGRIPVDATISWENAAEGGLEDIFDAVGYPFSFPMNWLFAFRYDRPKTQYDILIGNYLFHSMHNLGGLIELGSSDPPFIGNGWGGVERFRDTDREVRLARGPRSGIFVPTDRAESLRVTIECAVPEGVEPVPVEVSVNGARVGALFPSVEMAEHAFNVDARFWRRVNLLELVPVEDTAGEPFLAVDRLRFEQLSP